MKAPEEIFLRNKIRENYSVPENFYLQHFDYLNAENVLHWLTDFSSSKDARIKELEKEVEELGKSATGWALIAGQCGNDKKELEARLETAEKMLERCESVLEAVRVDMGKPSQSFVDEITTFLTNKTE